MLDTAGLDAGALAELTLFDEQGVIVLNKPPGIPTAGRTLHDPRSLQFALMQVNHRKMIWAVHQLDAATSGVNVFLRKKSLVPIWQSRMRYPNAAKSYVAVIEGQLPEPHIRVDQPIGWIGWGDNKRWGIAKKGKQAATQLRELASTGTHSVIQCTLESGRTHQIRVHLQYLGLSLVGEPFYRDSPCQRHPRQALHAEQMRFADGLMPSELRAPLPSDLRHLCDELKMPVSRWRSE
ncbi:MAG: 23S rRNA pseudouridine1911/1915/1917 synthase [Bradymonadia bacterium]